MNAITDLRPLRGVEIRLDEQSDFTAYLSRPSSAKGPGLLLLPEGRGVSDWLRGTADYFAEEGYVVLAPDLFTTADEGLPPGQLDADEISTAQRETQLDLDHACHRAAQALNRLLALPECEGAAGIVGYGRGASAGLGIVADAGVTGCAAYYPRPVDEVLHAAVACGKPLVFHFPAPDPAAAESTVADIRSLRGSRRDIELYQYPGSKDGFACRGHAAYDKPAAGMAYSRTLALLRREMGPHYDLGRIFDEHVMLEFVARDADATIATMVDDPYVNSVPVCTGGVGKKHLHRFYKYHFIPKNPRNTRMTPISRTICADRLVDEFIMAFTHDEEIDYMLPGIPPTGKSVEVPMIIVASFRGDKVYNEHIYWDQASVLVQIGLLDPAGLPVCGAEQAHKLIDKDLPSNDLMRHVWERSATAAAADRIETASPRT